VAERKAGNRSACARLTVPRRGHRPCPSAPLHLVPPGGAKPPRPVPAPPARMKAPSPLPWQRPSPLPQRVIAPCPAGGGQSPPASARPAPGGRFSPAGSGAGLCVAWNCGSTRHRPARAGETQVAFPDPARTDERTAPAAMAGAIAPATVPRRPLSRRGGPKPPGQRPSRPRRALLARRVGRRPLCLLDVLVYGAPSRAGGGNAGRVSCSRPKG